MMIIDIFIKTNNAYSIPDPLSQIGKLTHHLIIDIYLKKTIYLAFLALKVKLTSYQPLIGGINGGGK